MRVVALISGGKDSCFNMMQCVAAGHQIVALANLQPRDKDEMDSYMYQTVGHDGISLYAEALGLPLFRRFIQGNALMQQKQYSPVDGDEVEDLYLLLQEVKESIEFDGVSVGAILSDYQRIRVENVCSRLCCVSLAYLWRRNQSELLQEMIDCGIHAIIIKTASLGLDPSLHLGQTLKQIQPQLLKSKEKYSINVCGEGGEYETFTLDCPLFLKSIVVDVHETVIHSNDAIAPVGYLKLKELHLVNKPGIDGKSNSTNGSTDGLKCRKQRELLDGIPVKAPLDYLSELADCNKADCCDGRDEICPHQKLEESNNLGVEASTFSSNSSNCSGGGGGSSDVESFDNTRSKGEAVIGPSTDHIDGVRPKPNGIGTNDSGISKCTTRDVLRIPLALKITTNESGWSWITGIGANDASVDVGNGSHLLNNPMKAALEQLHDTLKERNMTLKNVIRISMYINSMGDYQRYNEEYIKLFSSQPPVRICVELPLPLEQPLIVEAVAFPGSQDDETICRKSMHVQGISHWAPANIGPYSQSQQVRDIIYVAGQIGLVPGSMKLVEGGVRIECKLALRHINRILRSTDSKVELRDVVQGICFVTDPAYIVKCREEWEKKSNNGIVEYIVVPRLPRDASVEWCVWAHMHNSAFEYEETGCYIGSGVKVKIIRRWSYESRVAVIICRASICDQTGKIGRNELTEIAEYALAKLLQEATGTEKSLESAVQIFYKVGALNPRDISEVFAGQLSVACSILPVCALVQENTVLSICGARHQ